MAAFSRQSQASSLYNGDKRSRIVGIMQSYTLTDVQNRQGEVFDRAAVEPVLLTEESRPSYVILSVHDYQQLIERLATLEDCVLGQMAEAALQNSRMVGTETFTAQLKRLAVLDSDDL